MFSPVEMDHSFFLPLMSSDFLQRVLLPQTALLLIMEDLKLTGEEGSKKALKVMQESSDYGAGMFPDNDEGDEGCTTAVDKIAMRRAQKKRRNMRVEGTQGTSAGATKGGTMLRKTRTRTQRHDP